MNVSILFNNENVKQSFEKLLGYTIMDSIIHLDLDNSELNALINWTVSLDSYKVIEGIDDDNFAIITNQGMISNISLTENWNYFANNITLNEHLNLLMKDPNGVAFIPSGLHFKNSTFNIPLMESLSESLMENFDENESITSINKWIEAKCLDYFNNLQTDVTIGINLNLNILINMAILQTDLSIALNRCKLAQNGYFLDFLKNDEDTMVRIAVAKQGYGLNTLVNDSNPNVRNAVAKQGYGLNKLINDKDLCVRESVNDFLNKKVIKI